MLQGTLNKFVTVPLATAFGLFLWDDIKSLMEAGRPGRMEGLKDELDALDPNTLRGLAWQSQRPRTC